MAKKPPEYLNKKRELSSKLDTRHLWERRHKIAGVGLDKLTDAAYSKLLDYINEIHENWPKGVRVTKEPTEFTLMRKHLYFKASFKKSSSGDAYFTSPLPALKDTIPYFPLAAAKIFQTGTRPRQGKGFRPSLHSAICLAIGERVSRASGSARGIGKIVENLNTGYPPARHAKALFIPPHAVKEVYTPKVISELVNKGIRIERVVEWTKNPKHVIKKLLKLEEKGELEPSAIKNLRELGF